MEKIRRSFRGGVCTAALLGLFGNWDGKNWGDEFFQATENELKLEEELGIPICLNGDYDQEGRDRRLSLFEYSYRQAQENWDFFDEHFELINYVSINNMRKMRIGAYLFLVGGLYVNCTKNGNYCLEDDDLVHELGHAWYFNLSLFSERGEFRDAWEEISGGEYSCSYWQLLSGECNYFRDCNEQQSALATSNCYGTSNLWEDVPEMIRLVYILNNPNWPIYDFPNQNPSFREWPTARLRTVRLNIIPETVPRIIAKIELLEEYEAFSERERDHAIRVLEDYLLK